MAQSTEDYLDSLLRQAMGIPDPEPEPKPEPDTSTLQREDVLAMADGLTGSNSAILGNAYDHNASFTNEGEINTSVPEPAAEVDQTPQAAEMIADADAPVATPMDVPESETILPDLESILPEVDLTRPESSEFDINEPTATETPIIEQEEIPVPDITNIIPDAPVIDHDESNLDIVPEPVIEITETDPDMIHIPSVEEPPVLEDMPIPEEEPAGEETPALEEEPTLEEAPALEDIPVFEEIPVIEATPVVEEESVIEEEPAAEEAPSEESAPEEVTSEEPAAEETPSGEPEIIDNEINLDDFLKMGDDETLEEISIPMDEEDSTPVPDQEITDLLSTLGEITGENKTEEAEEESGEAESEATDEQAGDVDLGGIDVFDTDLSAMLDDVTSSVESESGETGSDNLDDSDLGELLGSLDDGSGDLSDIGNLLEKDENSEIVDMNTETAEALFASDSEEDLFNIDNLIEEEEGSGKKKKKKKKGFSLFGKKKKKGEEGEETVEELPAGDGEMLIDPDLLDIPDESEIKKKKPGFFATLFAKLFEEVGEGAEDDGLLGIEQTAVEIAQEGAAENEAILSEMEGEGAEGGKKKKKEKKKKEKKKKDKKGESADGEEGGEAAEEDSKKKKKKEKKKKEKEPEVPGRKLPRKKVVAIALFCITIGLAITFLAFFIPYSQDMKKAKKFYSTGEYQKTYEYMRGHKLTESDQMLYDRTVTLLRIKRPYDSYQNYMKMGLRLEALNALVQGVQMSDRYAEDAATLGIIDKYSKMSRTIYDELYEQFGVTLERARSWIELEGTPEYTRALYECLAGGASIGTGEPAPDAGMTDDSDNAVIEAEENNL